MFLPQLTESPSIACPSIAPSRLPQTQGNFSGRTPLSHLCPTEVLIGQVVRPFILECSPELLVHEAAKRMDEARVSSILVVEDGDAIGIWTERDGLATDFRDPEAFNRPIRQVMSSPVRTIASSVNLHELTARFRDEHIRHYLVLDEAGARCGIVSQTDVVLNQGIEHYLKLRRVDSILQGKLKPLSADCSLSEATRLMREHATDALAITYPEGDFGILTERDVTRLVASRSAERPVGELASRPLLTVDERTSLYSVRCLLTDNGLRHVGVLRDDGSLRDLISFSDILTGMELAYIHELQHALRERDQALSTSQQHLHLAEKVIANSLDGIIITDEEARIISVNPAFTRLTGYSAADAIGRNPSMLASGRQSKAFYAALWQQLTTEGHWQGEIWNRRKDGALYPELLTITGIHDSTGVLTNYAALFSDISQLKDSEAQVRNLAYYDPLTGLPNRRLLEDRLQVALAHAHRSHSRVAIMFVDLDRFKRINDSLGHEIGDQLLIEVARRLKRGVREDDTVARMGGDEFIVVASDIEHQEAGAQTAARLIDMLGKPVVIDGRELVVTTSIGISIYPDDGEDAALLIRNADIAMYRAKDEGRNSFQLYQEKMNARSLEHLALETALHHALERDQLVLHYQPVVDAHSGRIVSAEALLRWQHPDIGLISPADFIPIAEDTGLIIPIGAWVLRTACLQHRQWRSGSSAAPGMMINLSALQFRDPNLSHLIADILAETGTEPHMLTLELTESTLMDDSEQGIAALQALRALGVKLAIDDFGTGYSSLAYLKRFPIDELKIDRLFIRDIDRNADDAAIACAIITLAHSLGLRVVAEGVESAAQRELLVAHGCDLMQGFHFSAAVTAASFPVPA